MMWIKRKPLRPFPGRWPRRRPHRWTRRWTHKWIGWALAALMVAMASGCASNALLINRVVDGDTVDIAGPEGETRLRLYGIDAPEMNQRYGREARGFIESLADSEDVLIDPMDRDEYGRVVGVLYVDGHNVNRELVKTGAAWVYRPFCRADFCSEWIGLESDARVNRRGLWYDRRPVPPWEWRRKAAQGR